MTDDHALIPMAAWPPGHSETAARVRAFDWSVTRLGDIARWPERLKVAVELALASPMAMIVLWGPALIQIYNDAYRLIMAGKHPAGLGQPTRECWPEVWPFNAPIYDAVLGGASRSFADQRLVVERLGEPEDAWFDLSYTPLGDGAGGVRGVLVTVVETTAKVRGEAALRASEASLSGTLERFFDLSLDLLATVSLGEGTWRRVNPAFTRVLGWTEEELVGAPSRGIVHPDDPAHVPAGLAQAAAGEPLALFESRLLHKDGGFRWISWSAAPSVAEGQLHCVGRDVTERKRAEEAAHEAEERQAFLLGLSDALRPLADPETIKFTASRMLGAYLRVDRCGCAEIDAEDWATYTGMWSVPGMTKLPERVPLTDDPGPLAVHKAGRTLVIDHVDEHPVTGDALPVIDRLGASGAFIAVPLIKAGRFAASWFVINAKPRRWTADERALVEDIAERTWATVERARAEAALKDSEARFRLTADAVPQIVWITDAEGRLEFFNRQWADYIGVPYEPTTAADVAATFIHPDDAAMTMAAFDEARRTGGVFAVEHRIRSKEGRYRWFLVRAEPYHDRTTGEIIRWFGASVDIHDRKIAEARVSESEERFRSFAENSADTLWIVSAETGQLEYLSPAFEAMWGETRERVMHDLNRWAELVHPEDRALASGGMPRLVAGETHQQTYRIIRPSDGAVRHIQDTGFPIRNAAGRVYRVAGIAQDVTGLKRAMEATEASETRLRILMEGIPQLVWRSSDQGEWTWSSPQWRECTGQTLQGSLGRGWLEVVHPNDCDATLRAWEEARPHGLLDVECRVRRASDGAYLWHHTRSTPVRDVSGGIVEWLGTTTDVQQTKELQERQAVMAAELQHRTRNLIAVVHSIAQQTMAATGPTPAFQEQFGGRMEALSRVQGLLSRSDQEPVTIETLIRTELDALGPWAGSVERITLAGPTVRLRETIVQTFALVIHELVTNARKYGALAGTEGRLSITWSVENENGAGRRLALAWIEEKPSGAAPPADPGFVGYGRQLIERALPYALGATTSYILDDRGVRCTIDLPLEKARTRNAC